MTQNQYRPDPNRGLEASFAYASDYAQSHRALPTLDYKRGYICSMVIDALLSDYVLLEVGCGTGGYFRLIHNHRKIVGLDFSKTMIDQGRELARELGLKRIEFVCDKFENYDPVELFDAVNLAGVIGWYVPWIGNERMFDKTRAMLKPGGIAVFSFVKPRNWLHFLKAILFPGRTVLIREPRFSRMTDRAKFKTLFSIDDGRNVFVFCQSPELNSN